ncbi:hypothetical protein LZK77_16325 [Rhizobium leguminosarum]|nr:hypothetical protein LZK77_16325 [Rhizobium leguminosarum]
MTVKDNAFDRNLPQKEIEASRKEAEKVALFEVIRPGSTILDGGKCVRLAVERDVVSKNIKQSVRRLRSEAGHWQTKARSNGFDALKFSIGIAR